MAEMTNRKSILMWSYAYFLFAFMEAAFFSDDVGYRAGGWFGFLVSFIFLLIFFIAPLLLAFIALKMTKKEHAALKALSFTRWVAFPVALLTTFVSGYGHCRYIGKSVAESCLCLFSLWF